jgi:U3 small nucleolar RNA-associated protein 25
VTSCSAAYLRQSILLSSYETPETRSLYNNLKNVAGKIRTTKVYNPIEVPAGIAQVNNHSVSYTALF